MTTDDPECEIGDIIYAAIRDNVVIEREAWAIDRVNRVMTRLGNARGKQNEFIVIIPWLQGFPSAFTAPGRYVFFSRSLFQLCRCDEMAAMVIAHEIAHHDLGHLRLLRGRFANAIGMRFKFAISALYRIIQKQLNGPEQERDADRHALELCLKAGYDGDKCISVYDILSKVSLDMRDTEGVYGLHEEENQLAGKLSLSAKVNKWIYQRRRGYFSIRDRKELLQKYLNGVLPPKADGN
jgi:predicted Zn-dependent protease